MEKKRSAPEPTPAPALPQFKFEHLHGVYQVMIQLPGNDYSKPEFWTKAESLIQMPRSLKELTAGERSKLWKLINIRIKGNMQKFKQLWRDFDRTAIGGNKYHDELKEEIIGTFFGGKSSDLPPELLEEEKPEKGKKKKKPAATGDKVKKPEGQKKAKTEESKEEKKQEINKNNVQPMEIKEKPVVKEEIKKIEPKEEKKVIEEKREEDEKGEPQKEEIPHEEIKAVSPNEISEMMLECWDRGLEVNLNKLYKISGKIVNTKSLDILDQDCIKHVAIEQFEEHPFLRLYDIVMTNHIPEEILNKQISIDEKGREIKNEMPENDNILAELVKSSGKTAEEIMALHYNLNGQWDYVKRELKGEQIKWKWNPKEDEILKLPAKSDQYMELVKNKGELPVLERLKFLKLVK